MSLFGRTASRIIPVVLEGISKTTVSRVPLMCTNVINKSFSCLSSSTSFKPILTHTNIACSCGCNGLHTKGDQELVSFLKDEITEEKKNMSPKVPAKLGDFSIKADKSQLILSRKFHDEEITISLDLNHSVDAESEAQESTDGQEAALKSKPSFEVDIKLGSRVMSFTCAFMDHEPSETAGQDTVEDLFGINELTVYDGEWSEDVYCVSGDILDGNLYDLLMNYLEERGISEEFANNLSEICTDYEHFLYVGLLEKVQNFVKRS